MRSLKQLTGILATGYILFFYSELMFWARKKPEDSLQNWLSTWLVYSLLAFVFLGILYHFHVDTTWGLFLAGAAFGWLTEGLVVQTAYEDLPLSLSFTGLAWHALISVWVGWGCMRWALSKGAWTTLGIAVLTGCGVGFWAITWWLEPDGGMAAPLDFAAYTFVSTLLLIAAYWLVGRCLPEKRAPNRKVVLLVGLLLGVYFLFVTIPAAPLAALILPILLLVLYLALRRNPPREMENTPTLPIPTLRYLNLLALPFSASLFYAAAVALGLRWHTNWVVYLVTTPAGFILLAISLVKVWRGCSSSQDEHPDLK